MSPDFYLHHGDVMALAKQRSEQFRQEAARDSLARLVAAPVKARRRFFRMFWVRKYLFRFSSRLAYKLVMTNDTESHVYSGGAQNHVSS